MGEQAGTGQLSPDGQWLWDGTNWVPSPVAPPVVPKKGHLWRNVGIGCGGLFALLLALVVVAALNAPPVAPTAVTTPRPSLSPEASPSPSPSPSPTPTRQPSPSAVPTKKPTSAPTVAPTQAGTPTQITFVTSPVKRGSNASLRARAAPNVTCTILVNYSSGPSHAAGLEPHTTNPDGYVNWAWKVGSNTTPGTYEILVTCEGGGTATTHFTVTS